MAKTNAGIRQKDCTMEADATIAASFNNQTPNGTVHAGKAVKISGDGQVALITTNAELFGSLRNLADDGYCGVNDEGWVDLPTDGTAITYGQGLVGGANPGTVKTGASATCRAICSAGTNKVRAKLF